MCLYFDSQRLPFHLPAPSSLLWRARPRDGLVVVWQLGTGATGRWLEGCLHVLLGHLQPVWQVEVSAALDLVVSGGQSGGQGDSPPPVLDHNQTHGAMPGKCSA